jgi:hemolysin activation/secretion protein
MRPYIAIPLVLAVLGAPLARAQQPPSAGQIQREAAQPAEAPRVGPEDKATPKRDQVPDCLNPEGTAAEEAFVLERVTFKYLKAFSEAELQRVTSPWQGKRVTAKELNELCKAVTRYYRDHDYLIAQAIYPQQSPKDGVIDIVLIEGILEKIEVNKADEAPVSQALVERMLYASLPKGVPITQRGLERGILSVQDLPGITVQSFLEAGRETGTTNLIVDVGAAQRRWDASADIDNYGSRFTGEYRAGFSGRLKSPFRLGDTLDLRLLTSTSSGLVYGRLAYDLPVAHRGLRFGVGLTSLAYDLGEEFASLDATGDAQIVDANLTYPIIRGRRRNLVAKLTVEHKDLTDRFGAVESRSDKRVRNFGAGVGYEARDELLGGGYLNLGLTVYRGNLDIGTDDDLAADQAPGGRRTNGDFTKLAYLASRLQAAGEKSTLYFGLTGQWANKNLDSSEKMALGGPRAIRAYAPSEALVDEGQILNLEYRYSITQDRSLTLSGFFDAGRGRVNAKRVGNDKNTRNLRGYGLEAFWIPRERLAVRASLAFRGAEKGVSDQRDRNPRLYANVVYQF